MNRWDVIGMLICAALAVLVTSCVVILATR